MKTMAIAGEPLPHFRSPVIRRIVVNKENFLVAVTLRHAGEKGRVTLALKNIPMRVMKPGPVEIHRSKYLLRVALTGRRNQRLVSAAGPSLVEAGVLAEAGFVPEEKRGLAFSRFFLAWDTCSAAIDLAPPGRPWPTCGAAAAPRSPGP